MAFGDIDGFTYGNINIKVLDVQGQKSMFGCDFKVCQGIGQGVRINGGVLVVKV